MENTRAGLATKLLPAHTAARGARVLATGQLLGRAGEEMARYLQHTSSSVCIVCGLCCGGARNNGGIE